MVKESGIRLTELKLESPDLPFGLGSGSSVIYGTTGGVAESVVRYCLPDKSKNILRELSYSPLRGNEGIRKATITVGGDQAGGGPRPCQCQGAAEGHRQRRILL